LEAKSLALDVKFLALALKVVASIPFLVMASVKVKSKVLPEPIRWH